MRSNGIDPAGFRRSPAPQTGLRRPGWMDWSAFNDRADRHISERLVELAGVRPEAGCSTSPRATASRRSPPPAGPDRRPRRGPPTSPPRCSPSGVSARRPRAWRTSSSSSPKPPASIFRRRASMRPSRGGGSSSSPMRRPRRARIRGLLEPGSRMAIASWGEPDEVPFLSIPMTTTRERLGVPPPPAGTPGRSPGPRPRPSADCSKEAGFSDVAVERAEVIFPFDSPEHFTAYVRPSPRRSGR